MSLYGKRESSGLLRTSWKYVYCRLLLSVLENRQIIASANTSVTKLNAMGIALYLGYIYMFQSHIYTHVYVLLGRFPGHLKRTGVLKNGGVKRKRVSTLKYSISKKPKMTTYN